METLYMCMYMCPSFLKWYTLKCWLFVILCVGDAFVDNSVEESMCHHALLLPGRNLYLTLLLEKRYFAISAIKKVLPWHSGHCRRIRLELSRLYQAQRYMGHTSHSHVYAFIHVNKFDIVVVFFKFLATIFPKVSCSRGWGWQTALRSERFVASLWTVNGTGWNNWVCFAIYMYCIVCLHWLDPY